MKLSGHVCEQLAKILQDALVSTMYLRASTGQYVCMTVQNYRNLLHSCQNRIEILGCYCTFCVFQDQKIIENNKKFYKHPKIILLYRKKLPGHLRYVGRFSRIKGVTVAQPWHLDSPNVVIFYLGGRTTFPENFIKIGPQIEKIGCLGTTSP